MNLLSKITTGIAPRAQRIVIYGPEGVGKTTLASRFPNALILDTENGSTHLSATRLTISSHHELIQALVELRSATTPYQTIIIDSIDWAEKMLVSKLLETLNKKGANHKSIEDIGYGKGYKMLEPLANELLGHLNALISQGKNIILIAHSRRVKFELPETAGAYDKYEINLTKFIAPLIKEWADAILFCNFLTTVTDRRGSGGSARYIYTSPAAPWEAKNRHSLPEMLPIDSEDLIPAILKNFGADSVFMVKQNQPVESAPALPALPPSIDQEKLLNFLVSKGWLNIGQSLSDLPKDQLDRLTKNTEALEKALNEWKG